MSTQMPNVARLADSELTGHCWKAISRVRLVLACRHEALDPEIDFPHREARRLDAEIQFLLG